VLGVSVDSPHCHKAYAAQHGISFPLLADFNKEVSRAYGVLMDLGPWKGVARRSAFVVARDGTVSYAWVSEQPMQLPQVDRLLDEASRAGAP
jgi:peroxiredoxin